MLKSGILALRQRLNGKNKLCDACGTKVAKNDESNQKEENEFLSVSEMKKCPYCSAQLQYEPIPFPTCGQEIRGRGVRNSVMKFFQVSIKKWTKKRKFP